MAERGSNATWPCVNVQQSRRVLTPVGRAGNGSAMLRIRGRSSGDESVRKETAVNGRTHSCPATRLLIRRDDRGPTVPRRRGGATPRLQVVACRAAPTLVAITLLLTGCADTRIGLDELTRLETEATQVEPVALETADLALTEIQPYTVGPSDILNITLTGLGEQYAQTVISVRVHDDGAIMLPMIGKVEVVGLDLKGVEQAIYDAHVPQYVKDMSVFVQLGGPEETTVVVVGAADQSGLVRLPRNERNVLYALSRAAGFSPTGSGRVHIRPVRPDRPPASYDLTSINDLRRALLAPPLESGDMIVVAPADISAIYVTGLVNAPGPVLLPQNGKLSLVRTLAAAGGLRDFLEPEEATLWRKLPDGEQVRVKLALTDVMSGKVGDIDLRPGDVLDVPHTAKTRARDWFASNIQIGPFGVRSLYDPVADRRARMLRNDDQNVIRQAFLGGISSGISGTVSRLFAPPIYVMPASP